MRHPNTILHDGAVFYFDRVGGTGEAIYQHISDDGQMRHVVLVDNDARERELRRRQR